MKQAIDVKQMIPRRHKVLFVVPSANPGFLSRFVPIPDLGPLYVATVVARANHVVKIYSEAVSGKDVPDELLKEYDFLCLSCMSQTVDKGRRIAQRYKLLKPDGKTVVGGIHASMLPEDVQNDFDFTVVGEAEEVILEIIEGRCAPGIVQGHPIQELDKVPVPDRCLLEGHERIKMWPAVTSRGCPYDCVFCSCSKMFGRKYRNQSARRVLDEFDQLKGTHTLFFDDNFTANPKRTDALLDMLAKRGRKGTWTAEVRSQLANNPELIARMWKAGCRVVAIGLESVNAASLDEMQKRQTVADVEKAIKVFHEHGIAVWGMFIFGNDADTKSIFKDTVSFCTKNKLDYAQFSVLTPFPGTRLYDKMIAEERLLHKNWKYYDAVHVVFKPARMTPEELQNGLFYAYEKLYSPKNGLSDLLDATQRLVPPFRAKGELHRRSLMRPALSRFFGRLVLKQWKKLDREYLDYLHNLPKDRMPGTPMTKVGGALRS